MQVLGFGLYGCLTPLRRLYPLPVRRTRTLPTASFRRLLAEDSLAVRLDPSPCRAGFGLSPVSRSSRHHSETNSASHGATHHAWRTTKTKPRHSRGFV
ncbi:hypothetical protein EO087_07515 [Dyella sp. M7H15-1]|nr:hypothetical protein EO087_07515 [Dyella sp. M7H15-1]